MRTAFTALKFVSATLSAARAATNATLEGMFVLTPAIPAWILSLLITPGLII